MWKNEFMLNGEATRFRAAGWQRSEWKWHLYGTLRLKHKNAKSFLRSPALPSDGAALERCDEKVSLSRLKMIMQILNTAMIRPKPPHGSGTAGEITLFKKIFEYFKNDFCWRKLRRWEYSSRLTFTAKCPRLMSSRFWAQQWSGKLIRHHCFSSHIYFFFHFTRCQHCKNVVMGSESWWNAFSADLSSSCSAFPLICALVTLLNIVPMWYELDKMFALLRAVDVQTRRGRSR